VSIFLDAGPSLNFLAVGQENVLIQLAASRGLQLSAPRKVDTEVFGMCKDPRFAATAALRTWDKLKSTQRVTILSDALTDARFADAVTRISGMPAHQRVRTSKSLGEIMVGAHASVLAQKGQHVYILMDDRDGRRRVKQEVRWLAANGAAGSIDLWSTPHVLKQADQNAGWIKNGLTWEQVYKQMRPFDAGLPPLPR
jgi:hypothetical protein